MGARSMFTCAFLDPRAAPGPGMVIDCPVLVDLYVPENTVNDSRQWRAASTEATSSRAPKLGRPRHALTLALGRFFLVDWAQAYDGGAEVVVIAMPNPAKTERASAATGIRTRWRSSVIL